MQITALPDYGFMGFPIRQIYKISAPVLLRICLRFAGLLMILVKYSLVDKLLLSDAEPLSTAVQRIHQIAQYVKFSIFTFVLHTDSHFIQGACKRFQPPEKLLAVQLCCGHLYTDAILQIYVVFISAPGTYNN